MSGCGRHRGEGLGLSTPALRLSLEPEGSTPAVKTSAGRGATQDPRAFQGGDSHWGLGPDAIPPEAGGTSRSPRAWVSDPLETGEQAVSPLPGSIPPHLTPEGFWCCGCPVSPWRVLASWSLSPGTASTTGALPAGVRAPVSPHPLEGAVLGRRAGPYVHQRPAWGSWGSTSWDPRWCRGGVLGLEVTTCPAPAGAGCGRGKCPGSADSRFPGHPGSAVPQQCSPGQVTRCPWAPSAGLQGGGVASAALATVRGAERTPPHWPECAAPR